MGYIRTKDSITVYRQDLIEFTKILLLLETHWRTKCLIGDPSETNISHRRPTCLIGDPSEIIDSKMVYRRDVYGLEIARRSTDCIYVLEIARWSTDGIYVYTLEIARRSTDGIFMHKKQQDGLQIGYMYQRCRTVQRQDIIEFTKLLFLSETYRKPIGDPSETDIPHRRPTSLIGDQHPSSETDMPQRRPIGDQHASVETHRRPTCLSGDPSETKMPHRKPIRNTCLAQGWSPIRHVGLR